MLCRQTNESRSNEIQRLQDHTEQIVESPVFFFGGPLLGIHDSALVPEVLYNQDGTRVAFCADPRLFAAEAAESSRADLFTVDDTENDSGHLDNIFNNAETFSDAQGLNFVSFL